MKRSSLVYLFHVFDAVHDHARLLERHGHVRDTQMGEITQLSLCQTLVHRINIIKWLKWKYKMNQVSKDDKIRAPEFWDPWDRQYDAVCSNEDADFK